MFRYPHRPLLKLLPGILQSVRRRYVVIQDFLPVPFLPENMRRLPAILVLHHPDEDPLRLLSGLRRLGGQVHQISCAGKIHPLAATFVAADHDSGFRNR